MPQELNVRNSNTWKSWPRFPGSDLQGGGVPAVHIYRPAPPPGRGGLGRFGKWILEFERSVPPLIEPLMGWTESDDPFAPIRLHFPDLQSAIEFAERHGWHYQVHDASIPATGGKTLRNAARYDIRNVLAQMEPVARGAVTKASS
jgi:hypothetical protein